jgi:hypothetical protein
LLLNQGVRLTDKKTTTTTFGLKPEKLVTLLRLGSDSTEDGHKPDLEQQKADYLQSRLEEHLPFESSVKKSLPKVLTEFHDTLAATAHEPIGKFLLSPQTELDLIKRIKDYSKELSKSSASEVEHCIANTLYYAAIASALVLYGQRITRFTWEELDNSLGLLTKEKWISKNIIELFNKARQYCQEKIENKA